MSRSSWALSSQVMAALRPTVIVLCLAPHKGPDSPAPLAHPADSPSSPPCDPGGRPKLQFPGANTNLSVPRPFSPREASGLGVRSPELAGHHRSHRRQPCLWLLCFTAKETEAQRGRATCSPLPSQRGRKTGTHSSRGASGQSQLPGERERENTSNQTNCSGEQMTFLGRPILPRLPVSERTGTGHLGFPRGWHLWGDRAKPRLGGCWGGVKSRSAKAPLSLREAGSTHPPRPPPPPCACGPRGSSRPLTAPLLPAHALLLPLNLPPGPEARGASASPSPLSGPAWGHLHTPAS